MLSLPIGLALSAHARTITVAANGADFRRIADAVQDADDGDVIEVAPGAYTEPSITLNRDVDIIGTGGSGATTWTGPTNDPTMFVQSGNTVTIQGFSVVGRASAVVFRTEGSVLTLRDLLVEGNRAASNSDGSALFAVRTTLTIEDSRFLDNRASDGRGGHLYVSEGTTTITNTEFEDGVADRGGAILFDNALATLEDCTFTRNGGLEGGAIAAFDGELTLVNVAFEQNSAEGTTGFPPDTVGDGGALFLDGDVVFSGTDSTFEGNTAFTTGGAVRVEARARAEFVATRFADNAADFGGGVYVGGAGQLTLTGSLFTDNEALDGSGGAVRLRSDEAGVALAVDGCEFDGNTATDAGGAIASSEGNAAGPELEIRATTFTANSADQGGAISSTGSSAVGVDSSSFCGNRGLTDGGALRVVDTAGDARLTNLVVTENRADGRGGGLYVAGDGLVELLNGTLLGDSAPDGGGVYVDDADVRVENTLVAYVVEGDGISGTSNGSTVDYSAFFDNVATDFPAAMGGTGNLTVDPQLQDYTRDGDCANDEVWPVYGSPLVDAGNPSVDDRDGSRSDIGAYGGPSAAWPELVDDDADGVFATIDCDDDDADIHPGADEHCDGEDEDCDGVADEDAVDSVEYTVDLDGDGYGAEDSDLSACELPPEAAVVGGDCDDADDSVFPGATEVCDGLDQDCDDAVDEDGTTAYWPDEDGDGFGDRDADPVQACGGDGLSADGTDCDDADDAVFPGAEDLAGDGLDADCDGTDGASSTATDTKLEVTSGCSGCAGTGSVSAGPAVLALALLALRRRESVSAPAPR